MEKVDATTIDTASNEKCSERMAKDTIHKNLLAVIADRTHGSRRGASRPTEADPYLKELFEKQVRGRHSMIQRIHRSPLMKEWYRERCRTNAHPSFRNSSSLGAAKHRHDSWSDPAVQWVMTLEAVHGTAERATLHFPTSEEVHADAAAFLETIGPCVVFDMGLLTDALVECQLVVRIFDDDCPSSAEQIPIVRHWRHRLKYLYLDHPPGCMSSTFTYTRIAMDLLDRGPHVVKVRGKILREYGGPGCLTTHMIEKRMSRMKRYLDMVDTVLTAEFPDFDLVSSFCVFRLGGQFGGDRTRHANYGEEDKIFWKKCIERLSTVFRVCRLQLQCQLNPLLGLATEIQKQKGCTPREALREAYRLRKKSGTPMDAVSLPLWRFLSWVIVTSDLERDFALERRLFPHKGHCTNQTRFRLMRLASGCPSTYKSEDLKRVLGRAQELWVQRHSDGTRQLRTFDARKGQRQRVHKDQRFTKARWKRQRTKALDDALSLSSAQPSMIVHSFPEPLVGTSSSSSIATANAFNKELQFNKDKYQKQKMQAMRLGTLIASEKSREFIDAAEADDVKQKKLDRARLAKEKGIEEKVKGFTLSLGEVFDKPIFVSTRVGPSHSNSLEVKLAHFNQVSNVMAARVVVSSTLVLGKMGDRLACAVMLCGMIVVRPGFIYRNCKACLTCKAAVNRRRRLFLTEGFRTKYPGLVDIIVAAAQRPASRWLVFETLEQYIACYTRTSAHTKSQVIALTRHSEDIPGIAPGAKRLTKEQFMQAIEFVDVYRTRGSL